MSVRKRKWTTAKGIQREAWLVDYTDQHGKRHAKTFDRKKDADAYASATDVEVRGNSHVADSDTITVEEAGKLWVKRAVDELERGTADQYGQHLNLHIIPFIGKLKLSKITVPAVRKFMDDLTAAGRSTPMVKGVRTSLGSIIAEAQERGYVVRNAVRDMSNNRKGKTDGAKRRKAKLIVGEHIPTREEIQLFLGELSKSTSNYRVMIITAIFTGMRASELRGLRWADVDLEGRRIRITQRADKYNKIGMPKSEAGQRTIPMFPMVFNTLTEWKEKCPRKKEKGTGKLLPLEFVFPNGQGNVESHSNILQRGLWAPQIAAGVVREERPVDAAGKPQLDDHGYEIVIIKAKYPGLHALRHWFASWCINSKARGGRGMTPKEVQDILGHSTIGLTLDTYGHLFKDHSDNDALAEAEAALLTPVSATQTQHAV
ncbi:tyrosine-type recombinase/integrase [Mesorhizobium sp. M7A.F.Ca.US.008.03.1.1]|uniref:tyrosine-type recombinase/integrase n=1 Tax=Mesorhizobium sp. M7A.F.Ca.US.008.03.1.1 TaxID=2496742 RepID=UPI000FCC2A5E|nr:tyrosine-type recombinase/integrase [Mesorhizobium sp. M7A.F.Ca.US.008.03.1.1]RUW58363.1 site-specific integrase [Mesorhizobium sp. M7A.F.Ca.US.008.03.1.1]